MGQLDVLVQTAPADPGIPTLAVWSLVARCSHMTRSRENGVCMCMCVRTVVDVKNKNSSNTLSTLMGVFLKAHFCGLPVRIKVFLINLIHIRPDMETVR